MAVILVVGPDAALLEGVSQTLVGAGHEVLVARDVPEALESLGSIRPLVAVVDRDELVKSGVAFRAALGPGAALIAFNNDDTDGERLPFALKRATLAELQLPLERQRLLALVRNVEARAHAAGRDEEEATAIEAERAE